MKKKKLRRRFDIDVASNNFFKFIFPSVQINTEIIHTSKLDVGFIF